MNNTMTNEPSDVELVVMRHVRRIRILRLIISGVVFALTASLLALYVLGREVWVAHVLENGPQTFSGHLLYFVYAFEHTRFVVQALVVVCVASFVYIAREALRSLALLPSRGD